MEDRKTKKIFEKLYLDYLDLCEKYQNDLKAYEFGSCMITITTKMLLETAPDEKQAFNVILESIKGGIASSEKGE